MALIETCHDKLILLGILLRYGLCRIVELAEDIGLGLLGTQTVLSQLGAQVIAEGLCCRQEHASALNGVALHKVEVTVGVGFVVVVQAVAAQEFDERCALHPLVRDIGQIDTSGVALELDVETELLLLHRRGEVIDVFHHQSPVVLCGVARGVTQGLDEESLRGLGEVAGKLAHLVGHTTQGVFVGYGQHLVSLQTSLQGDIAQRLVQGVFR